MPKRREPICPDRAAGQSARAVPRAGKSDSRGPKRPCAPAPEEAQRLTLELRALQAELEAKGEQLPRAPVGCLTVSELGTVLKASLTAATLLGESRDTLVGQPLSRFVHPEEGDGTHLLREQGGEPAVSQERDVRLVRADGTWFWAQLQAAPLPGRGRRILLSDITERKKIEEAQHFLLTSGYQLPGEDFFKSLAHFLAVSLATDFVCIDRLQGDALTARTVAVYADGRFEDDVEYALKDTPCGEVVGKTICRFDAGVRRLFPQDAVLQDLAAEGYAGTTLWSFEGKPIGLIALIWRTPLPRPRLVEAVLKMAGVRAAAELERRQADDEIRALSRFPSENPNPVIRFDRSGRVLYANEASRRLPGGGGFPVGEAAPEPWRTAAVEAFAGAAPRTLEVMLDQQVWSVCVAPLPDAGYVNLYATDRTEQARTERALRESEERYRIVVESSRDLVFFLDRSGRLRWLNPAARELLGAGSQTEDLLGRAHPEDSTRIVAAWQEAWEGDASAAKVGYRVRAADGGYHTLESLFRKITLAGEALLCAISTDVTELTKLRRKVSSQLEIAGIVGRDPKMLELYGSIRELAEADAPVLILGESGTGKELVAAAIHRESPRARRNFVAINCGAIPDTLLETELFGHVRGAFTGAVRDKKGRFELADGGTIFLDEVGDLSPAMQVKLLRILQEGTFERVGAEKPSAVDVRVISATNRDLKREVAAGRFREDLFYRLSVVPLTVPPLRERVADIPLLVEHILGEEVRRSERRRDPARAPRRLGVSRGALALLLAHPWPGNVRELQNVLRFALIKCKGSTLRPEHLPPFFTVADRQASPQRGRRPKLSGEAAARAVEQAGGSAVAAARRLGVSRATLYRHLPKAEG